jgi:tRNA(fMet)-specific endonuclease VapC
MYILDTDHASLYQHGDRFVGQRLATLPPNQLATTIATYEEQIAGRLAVVRRASPGPAQVHAYLWLARTLDFFCRIPVLPFDEPTSAIFQRLISLSSTLYVFLQDNKGIKEGTEGI